MGPRGRRDVERFRSLHAGDGFGPVAELRAGGTDDGVCLRIQARGICPPGARTDFREASLERSAERPAPPHSAGAETEAQKSHEDTARRRSARDVLHRKMPPLDAPPFRAIAAAPNRETAAIGRPPTFPADMDARRSVSPEPLGLRRPDRMRAVTPSPPRPPHPFPRSERSGPPLPGKRFWWASMR